MKKRWVALIGLLIALLQAYFGQLLQIKGIVPDIVLVYVVCVALFMGHEAALWSGLVTGLFYDISFGDVIGFYSIYYVGIGYFIGYYRYNFFYSNIQIAITATMAATVLKEIYIALLNIFMFSKIEMFNFNVLIYAAIYNIFICIILHNIFTKLRKWSENERK